MNKSKDGVAAGAVVIITSGSSNVTRSNSTTITSRILQMLGGILVVMPILVLITVGVQ